MSKLKAFFLLLLLTAAISSSFSQEFTWKLGYNYFFDNAEYALSSYSQDQTMHGMNLMPELGLRIDERQTVYAGVNLLKIGGSPFFTDREDFMAYYQYKTPKVIFRAGSFPKEDMLDNYSTLLFKDSVRYFRPIMHGVFVKVNNDNNDFFNIWLDWTGYGSKDIRESFFVGASGLKKRNMFFAEMQSYLYHYANTTPTTERYHVSEQFQMNLSLGVSHSNNNGLDTLMFSVGGLFGLERDRGVSDDFDKPIGLTMRINAEYRGLGTDNIAYFGDKRMSFYNNHGDNLYWGSPFLQGSSYIQSKWYANLIRSARTNVRVGLNMHITEKHVFFQQAITLTVNINRHGEIKKHSETIFPLMRFFSK